MTATLQKEEKFKKQLEELAIKLIAPGAQLKIIDEIITQAEFQELCERTRERYPGEELDPPEVYHAKGVQNLADLSELRGITQWRLVLDLSVELGLLNEATYHRYVDRLESKDVVRRSVSVQYKDGELFVNGHSIGRIQQRTKKTRLQKVLEGFQTENWPKSIKTPKGWDGQKVKNVCRELRSKFGPSFQFFEMEGGQRIGCKTKSSSSLRRTPK